MQQPREPPASAMDMIDRYDIHGPIEPFEIEMTLAP